MSACPSAPWPTVPFQAPPEPCLPPSPQAAANLRPKKEKRHRDFCRVCTLIVAPCTLAVAALRVWPDCDARPGRQETDSPQVSGGARWPLRKNRPLTPRERSALMTRRASGKSWSIHCLGFGPPSTISADCAPPGENGFG